MNPSQPERRRPTPVALSDREALRRTIYLVSLLLAVPIFVGVGRLEWDDPATRYPYLAIVAWLLPAGLTLWARPGTLRAVERGTALFMATTWIARTGLALFAEPVAMDAVLALAPSITLGTVMVMLLLHFTFPTLRATFAILAFLALTSSLGALRFAPDPAGEATVEFVRHQFFLLVLTGFLYVLSTEQQARARAEAERERLRAEAYRDALTGLPNRRFLDETLESAVANARRTGAPLSVVVFDLDRFKRLNDTHGHEVGDAALIRVATAVRPLVREEDVVGRFGGEEFLILVPNGDHTVAATVAERAREAIARVQLDPGGPITASFGVASLRDGDEGSDLVRRADARLYRAKRAGRNRVDADPLDDPDPA